jgi:hypothetical protein
MLQELEIRLRLPNPVIEERPKRHAVIDVNPTLALHLDSPEKKPPILSGDFPEMTHLTIAFESAKPLRLIEAERFQALFGPAGITCRMVRCVRDGFFQVHNYPDLIIDSI